MDATGLALWLAALGLVVFTGRRAVPLILMRLWPLSLKVFFDDSPEADVRSTTTDSPPEWVRGTAGGGLVLLGRKVEKLPLWGPRYAELSFAARDGRCFASLVLNPAGAPVAAYLYTPLRSGAIVFTRDFAAGREWEASGSSVRNVVTGDMRDLFRSHEARLQGLEASGQTLDLEPTREGRIRATYAFYSSEYYRRTRGATQNSAMGIFALALALFIWATIVLAL